MVIHQNIIILKILRLKLDHASTYLSLSSITLEAKDNGTKPEEEDMAMFKIMNRRMTA